MKLETDKKQIEHFMSKLWPDAERGHLALVSLSNGSPKPVFVEIGSDNALKSAPIIASNFVHRESNAYHTLGLLNARPTQGRGKMDEVIAIPGLWMDIDCASGTHTKMDLPDSIPTALTFLRQFPLKPSLVVNSGGGLH